MADEIGVASLGLFYAFLLAWGFKVLPGEKWQILASLPSRKREDGNWEGLNLTFYGLFIACSYTLASAILFLLLGAVGIPVRAIVAVSVIMAALCVPASRLIAPVVEKKAHTATVGGASFVGIILAPWCIWCVSAFAGRAIGFEMKVMDVLAALAIAYAFGEGTGRLACISFGCCYGKPLSLCGPFIRFLFRRASFVFTGKTKKIAYERGMDGEAVIPVQAVTSVIYISSALAATYLFLKGKPAWAFLGAVGITQVWRFLSEFFRADHRGTGSISAYQWMGLASVPYAGLVALLFAGPVEVTRPSLTTGLLSLWDPAVLIVLQATWCAMFVLTARSMVTGSVISFHVNREQI